MIHLLRDPADPANKMQEFVQIWLVSSAEVQHDPISGSASILSKPMVGYIQPFVNGVQEFSADSSDSSGVSHNSNAETCHNKHASESCWTRHNSACACLARSYASHEMSCLGNDQLDEKTHVRRRTARSGTDRQSICCLIHHQSSHSPHCGSPAVQGRTNVPAFSRGGRSKTSRHLWSTDRGQCSTLPSILPSLPLLRRR